MQPWNTLSPAEQTLMRRGLWQRPLAGTVQQYGIDLRWAGAAGAPPPRSWTEDEQRALVPGLAAVAEDLVGRGLLTVRVRPRLDAADSDPALTGPALREALAEPADWLWPPVAALDLRATGSAREWWQASTLPEPSGEGLPDWDELTLEEQKVLVCASEGSGFLTGPYGIWKDLPDGPADSALTAWVERQLAPLVPLVRKGWVEVRHVPTESGDAFTVVPLEELPAAFADRALRHDDGDLWGVGFTCVFTYAGLAVWRTGCGRTWGSRLRFD